MCIFNLASWNTACFFVLKFVINDMNDKGNMSVADS